MSCPLTTLTPGQTTNCAKTYTLTQADLDAGHVANTATATGTPPSGLTAPTATDSTDTPISPGASISLDKQGGTPSGSPGSVGAGSTISYSFVIRNTGNVTLSNVGVVDPKVGPVTCPVTTLAPDRDHDLHEELCADPGRCRRGLGQQHGNRLGDPNRRSGRDVHRLRDDEHHEESGDRVGQAGGHSDVVPRRGRRFSTALSSPTPAM